MNQINAFAETLQFITDQNRVTSIETPDTSFEHLFDMLTRIREAEYTGNKFSDSKKGRWLGYAQGVCVAHEWLTLDECKEINKRNSK